MKELFADPLNNAEIDSLTETGAYRGIYEMVWGKQGIETGMQNLR